MTKARKIPIFKSVAEEARFWDTHDVTDYLGELKEVKAAFAPLTPKEETLTIRIQAALKRKLENLAQSYGINLSTLLRIWLIDRLKATNSRLPKLTE
ncbi:hypothetical protein FJZ40_03010 [Candidatus Shapirobacteria bacterium]|nr:hypothetical protein [Candidatus Shapirobacteria bacterium]